MSEIAISTYGIDIELYHKVCSPRPRRADAEGFARIYISGLHKYITELEFTLKAERKKCSMLEQRVKDKDEMIGFLKQCKSSPIPSAPPQGETS